jgi:hypothetical protein
VGSEEEEEEERTDDMTALLMVEVIRAGMTRFVGIERLVELAHGIVKGERVDDGERSGSSEPP